jgi:hypothetical protein
LGLSRTLVFGRTAVVERITSCRALMPPQQASSGQNLGMIGRALPDLIVSEPGTGGSGAKAEVRHGLSRPSRWATAAASPRPATPSLARILETWTLAVLGVMNRA